jgi:hypothetical protein
VIDLDVQDHSEGLAGTATAHGPPQFVPEQEDGNGTSFIKDAYRLDFFNELLHLVENMVREE